MAKSKLLIGGLIAGIIAFVLDALTGGFIRERIVETFANEGFKQSVTCGIGGYFLLPIIEANIFGHIIKIPWVSIFTLIVITSLAIFIVLLLKLIGFFSIIISIIIWLGIFIAFKIIGLVLVLSSGESCLNVLLEFNELAKIGILGLLVPIAIGITHFVGKIK